MVRHRQGGDTITAKEYLKSIRTLDIEINSKKEELINLNEKLTILSPQGSDTPVKSSGTTDITKTVDKIIDLQREIETEINELVNLRLEARVFINQLADLRFRVILTDYYINGDTWEQVAQTMKYDLRWIYRLHGRALQDFEKILNKPLKATY